MKRSLSPTAAAIDITSMAQKARFCDIDRVKAVAILLVVIGHILDPRSPAWWQTLRFDIYNFHMPLFMYLSGYVYFRAVNKPNHSGFFAFCFERANRLLVPFIVFGFIVINVKFFARSYADLRRSDFSYFDGFRYLILDTSHNPAFDLWYLFVLFVFSVGSYHIMRRDRLYLFCLLAAGLFAYSIFAYYEPRGGMTDDLYLDHICWFYVFFVLGATACAWREELVSAQKAAWPFAALLFIGSEFLMNNETFAFASGWRFLFIGSFSIVFLHGMMLAVNPNHESLTRAISESTLLIYLLNSIIIAGVQQTLYKTAYVTNRPYVLQAAFLVVAATIIPIVLRRIIFRTEFLKPVRPYVA